MSAIDPNTTPLHHPSSSHMHTARQPTLPSPPPSPTSSNPPTVLPQPVTDPSLLDSVAGFINDVVPQAATAAAVVAYNGVGGASGSTGDGGRDQIQWARFEQRGVGTENETEDAGWRWFGSDTPDVEDKGKNGMVLVVGYTNGVQVWSIPANGEAVLLLSWRHGSVRVLRILPQPLNTSSDLYAAKRPLIALCDNASPGGNQYCSLSFISLKTGEQVKVIKFSKPIVDIHANSRSICVALSERIAVFSASTLEDRLTVTTCYPSPGLHPNPVALGARWLAYAEGRLIPARRSGGGSEGEGVQSYTATVLHAAKSLGRGLRELGETVASSLTGTKGSGGGMSGVGGVMVGGEVQQQKGVVTILDIESASIDPREKIIQHEAVMAHFVAHTEAIVCMSFDPSGMLLLTADKRGHDFHLFRIHPHPAGPHLAAVHHLYILHRGDTSARVQDATFSPDSRWCAVTTLRGTTHVFPTTPYGGPISHRTHSTPHIVNRMSRFHRSAGLNADLSGGTAAAIAANSAAGGPATTTSGVARSNSPVPMVDQRADGLSAAFGGGGVVNPRLGPYPGPTVVMALAQIRQQLQMGGGSGGQNSGGVGGGGGHMGGRTHSGRQRLSSGSESDSPQVALRVSTCFAPPRAWLDGLQCTRESTNVTKPHARPVESLFIMSCHGSLIQYDLDPHHATGIPKEKICDDTSIELSATAKAQWPLQRQPRCRDLQLPLSGAMLSHIYQERLKYRPGKPDHTDDRWLSQVEIVTHAGPHRRLWMGPQFQFQTYQNGAQGTPQNILDTHHSSTKSPSPLTKLHSASKPVNIKPTLLNNRCSAPAYPILIEAGSVSSCEPSPKLFEQHLVLAAQRHGVGGETQLREDLADAMIEQERQQQQQINNAADRAAAAGASGASKEAGGRCVIVSLNTKPTSFDKQTQPLHGVNKIVNPLGTVFTVTAEDGYAQPMDADLDTNVIMENCDESLFRPVVQSKAVVYAEPICLQTKITATNTIHVSTNKPKPKKNGKKIVQVEAKEKTPPPPSAKIKKQKQEPVLPPLNHFETSTALQQSLNQDDLITSTAVSLSVDDAMQEAAIESAELAEQTSLCDFSDVVCDYPEQFVADNPVVPDDLDTYAYSPSPSKTEEVSQKKPIKYDRYQGLDPKDIVVSSSEENAVECERTLSKKPRKPKAKLGVRINKESSMSESKKSEDFRLLEPLEFEVIPAPKFSWSSIVAAPAPTLKTAELINLPDDHDWTIGAFSTFDAWNEFPEIAHAPEQAQEPMKATWSAILKTQARKAAKRTDVMNVETTQLIQVDSDVEAEVKLKLSSDEDKPSEPSAEDDDSPANAMDTEEDAQKTRNGMSKVNKRKSKKKKK